MLKAKLNKTACFLRMLLPAPLSLGFSRLMGSVIPYLNTSWTAFKGMLLFVSKLGCPPLFSISENKWRSWNCQWCQVRAGCACSSISPIPLGHVLFSLTSPSGSFWVWDFMIHVQCAQTLLCLLLVPICGISPALCWSQCSSQAGSCQPQCHAGVRGGEGQSWPAGLGNGQQEKPGNGGSSALASSLLLSEPLKIQVKQEIIHIKKSSH